MINCGYCLQKDFIEGFYRCYIIPVDSNSRIPTMDYSRKIEVDLELKDQSDCFKKISEYAQSVGIYNFYFRFEKIEN